MNITKTNFIKTAISAGAALGIATIMASTTSANAGNLSVDLYLGSGPGIYYSGGNNSHYWGGYGPRYNTYNNHNQKRYRQPPRRKICGPRQAVKKAYRLGMKNPQVRRVEERKIVVAGFQYGYRTKMAFQRYSNCRLIQTANRDHNHNRRWR